MEHVVETKVIHQAQAHSRNKKIHKYDFFNAYMGVKNVVRYKEKIFISIPINIKVWHYMMYL